MKAGMLLAFGGWMPIKLPRAPVRREEEWEEIARLRGLISGSAPFESIRAEVLLRLHPMCMRLKPDALRSEEASRLLVHCWELLRDVGTAGPPAEAYGRLLVLAEDIAKYWDSKEERVRFAWAILAVVNIRRARQDWGGAPVDDRYLLEHLNLVDNALARLNSTNREVVTARHQVSLWRLRLFSGAGDYDRAATELNTLRRRTELIGLPVAWLDFHREAVGYWNRRGRGDFGKAEEALGVLDRHVDSMAPQPSLSELTIIRPRIEFLLARGRPSDKEEAIHRIETEYLPQYRTCPTTYYCDVLKCWEERCGIRLHIPAAKITDGTLVHRYLLSKEA